MPRQSLALECKQGRYGLHSVIQPGNFMLSLNPGVRNLFLSEGKVRVSLEFTCIQPCTPAQLCPPSYHQRKTSISFGTGCWSCQDPQVTASSVGTGTENTPLPHVPVRKSHIPVPAEGSSSPGRLLDEAGSCSTPAKQVHWTHQGYCKGSTVEHFHGGPVLYLNGIELPGNTRAECKEMCVLWVNHNYCKNGIKGLK